VSGGAVARQLSRSAFSRPRQHAGLASWHVASSHPRTVSQLPSDVSHLPEDLSSCRPGGFHATMASYWYGDARMYAGSAARRVVRGRRTHSSLPARDSLHRGAAGEIDCWRPPMEVAAFSDERRVRIGDGPDKHTPGFVPTDEYLLRTTVPPPLRPWKEPCDQATIGGPGTRVASAGNPGPTHASATPTTHGTSPGENTIR
jgi:hypothetical protein